MKELKHITITPSIAEVPDPRYAIVEDARQGHILVPRPVEPKVKPPLRARIRLFLVKYFTPSGWAVRYYLRQAKKQRDIEAAAHKEMVARIANRWKEPPK